jgi:hypothetical protein
VITINKETVAARVVDDVVIGDEQTGKGLRAVPKDGLGAGIDIGAIEHVLINGDVLTAAVHPDRCRGIIAKAVIADLHVVVGPSAGEDDTVGASRSSREREPVDRDQAVEGDKECRRPRGRR